jgi:hypothetical protein
MADDAPTVGHNLTLDVTAHRLPRPIFTGLSANGEKQWKIRLLLGAISDIHIVILPLIIILLRIPG